MARSPLDSIEPIDFKRRKRHGRLWVLTMGYSALFAVILAYMVQQQYLTRDVTLVMMVLIVTAVLILHSLYNIQRNLDVILAAEFQNAILSAAVNTWSDFTLILGRDNSAFYADLGFRRHFPGFHNIDSQVIDHLLGTMKLEEGGEEKFLRALNEETKEQFMTEIPDDNGELRRYVVSVTPLKRPQGYTMVQGRVFVQRQPKA